MSRNGTALRVESIARWSMELRTRLPFKYGIATMTELPHVFVAVWLRTAGERARGIAADHLPPKWFTKEPQRAVADEIADMHRVIAQAAALAEGLEAGSPFDFWLALHRRMEAWRVETGWPPLLVHFGTSLLERAVIDAFCRAQGRSFAELLRAGGLGFRPAEIHPELAGAEPRTLLPARPIEKIVLRHTVGLADPLDAADREKRVGDGLPETLVENIAAYGLRHFKIKFTGARDLARLERTLRIVSAHARGDVRFTLDGNESFGSVEEFRAVWSAVEALPSWPALRDRLLCVEQPLHRDRALADDTAAALRAWTGRPPTIVDESDAEFDSVRRALAAGYVGTSHKNCKGVFRGIANACLLAFRRDPQLRQTGEDLANVGPVALLQDLAVQATLGIRSVERNGHAYFRGVSFLPEDVQRQLVAAHPDLYRWHAAGFAALAPIAGELSVASVNAAPFGSAPQLEPDRFAQRIEG